MANKIELTDEQVKAFQKGSIVYRKDKERSLETRSPKGRLIAFWPAGKHAVITDIMFGGAAPVLLVCQPTGVDAVGYFLQQPNELQPANAKQSK